MKKDENQEDLSQIKINLINKIAKKGKKLLKPQQKPGMIDMVMRL